MPSKMGQCGFPPKTPTSPTKPSTTLRCHRKVRQASFLEYGLMTPEDGLRRPLEHTADMDILLESMPLA